MVQHWYQSILFEKFGCASCTLAELKALPDHDVRIRIYIQSLAPRLFSLIKLLLAGFADQPAEGPDTVLAQLARITGEEGMAQVIHNEYLRNTNYYVMGAFVEIIKRVRPEFEHPGLEDRGTIQRYLRFNPRDELVALAFIVEKEKAKRRGKRTRLDDLLSNNGGDIVAVAKVVKKAMGKIADEKEVLKYFRSNNADKPASQKQFDETSGVLWLSATSRKYAIDGVARSGSAISLIENKQTHGRSAQAADNGCRSVKELPEVIPIEVPAVLEFPNQTCGVESIARLPELEHHKASDECLVEWPCGERA
jgi:hypothetical protein